MVLVAGLLIALQEGIHLPVAYGADVGQTVLTGQRDEATTGAGLCSDRIESGLRGVVASVSRACYGQEQKLFFLRHGNHLD